MFDSDERTAEARRDAARENADVLLTLPELQRRFFASGCAPSKKRIREWIRRGRDGVFLDAVLLDEKTFVRVSAFERFLRESAAPRFEPKRRRRFSNDVEDALKTCAALGVKLKLD